MLDGIGEGFLPGFEGGELYIGSGQAEGAEEQGARFVVDVAGEDEAQDFGEDYLDGVGVFEGREVERGLKGFVEIELVGAAAVLVVKKQCRSVRRAGDPHWTPLALMCWQRGIAQALGVLVGWGVVDICAPWE